MAHQYMPRIFHGSHKKPPAPPPTYLMYGPLCDGYCHVPRKFHSLKRVLIHIIQLLTKRMILEKNLKKKLFV